VRVCVSESGLAADSSRHWSEATCWRAETCEIALGIACAASWFHSTMYTGASMSRAKRGADPGRACKEVRTYQWTCRCGFVDAAGKDGFQGGEQRAERSDCAQGEFWTAGCYRGCIAGAARTLVLVQVLDGVLFVVVVVVVDAAVVVWHRHVKIQGHGGKRKRRGARSCAVRTSDRPCCGWWSPRLSPGFSLNVGFRRPRVCAGARAEGQAAGP
jgi:hypothetical protein